MGDERTGMGRARANAAYVAARASRDVWPRKEKTGCVGMCDEMTGAELLREAAALMRERAEAAEHLTSPWSVSSPRGRWDGYTVEYATDNPDAGLVAQCADYLSIGAADHIASWHPGVALAVADWLDNAANTYQDVTDAGDYTEFVRALNVARAYLSAPVSAPVSAGEPKEDA